MSMIAALARIDDIQQRLRTLSPEADAPTGAAASTGGASASATTFASAVDAAAAGYAVPAGGATGADIVERAQSYLGVPYVFGGEDRTGMDCSGLVQRVLADLGIDAPRVVQDQADIGVEVPSLAEAQPGDLIVERGEGHILIYAGDGKVIHAPSPGKNVELRGNYLTDADIGTIRRVVPAADAGGPAVAAASFAGTGTGEVSAATTGLAAGGTSSLLAGVALLRAASGPVSGSTAAATSLAAFAGAAPGAASSSSPVDMLAAALASLGAAGGNAAGARSEEGARAASPATTSIGTASITTPPATAASIAPATGPTPPATPATPAARTTPGAAEPVVLAVPTPAPVATPTPITAPEAPAAAPTPTRTPFATQVTAPVLSLAAAGDGTHTVTLRVSPDTLGPVTVTAQITGGVISVELTSATDPGRDALRAMLGDLRRDLAALAPHSSVAVSNGDAAPSGQGGLGAGVGSGSWSTPGQPGGTPRGERAPDAPAGTAPHEPEPAAAPHPAAGGIDLFA